MGWAKLPCLAFSIKDEHRMFCFNPSLHPPVLYKKREAGLSLALSLSQLTPTPLNICGEELGGCAIHLPTCPPHSVMWEAFTPATSEHRPIYLH